MAQPQNDPRPPREKGAFTNEETRARAIEICAVSLFAEGGRANDAALPARLIQEGFPADFAIEVVVALAEMEHGLERSKPRAR